MSGMNLPDIHTLLNGNIIDVIKNIFKTIFMVINAMFDYLFRFVEILSRINLYIVNLISSIESGNVDGLPFLEFIGAYRYLVGDTIFELTYMSIVCGALFTLYKLLLILYRRFKDAKNDTVSNSNSLGTILSVVTKFFKK